MKKMVFVWMVMMCGFIGIAPVSAQTGDVPQPEVMQTQTIQVGSEIIRNFSVHAKLTEDRRLRIREEIEYDFGERDRHGIFRMIPETYERDGKPYEMNFRLVGAWRNGEREIVQEEHKADNWILRIGKESVEIQGLQTYAIEYETDQAINFFNGHTELYWNVTGNAWPIPIEKASFFLESPVGNASSTIAFQCFTGIAGSVEEACHLESREEGFLVSADRPLKGSEGLTVVFGFPVGVIHPPTRQDVLWGSVRENWIAFFPFIALIVMLFLWRSRGKDPEARTVIPRYTVPKKLSPMLLAHVLGKRVPNPRGITASLIEMAQKGWLKIAYEEEGKKDTEISFIKKEHPPESASKWDRTIWNGLFKQGEREQVSVKELKKEQFYRIADEALRNADWEIGKMKIFVHNPLFVVIGYVMGAFMAGYVTSVIGGGTAIAKLSAYAVGLVIAIVGWFMPRRTREGSDLVTDVKGFKWFLEMTEKDRLDFHNAPARTPDQFMEFLPAAIALGVENKWAEQFKDMQIPPPEWMSGAHTLNSVALVNQLSQTNKTALSAMSSAGSGGSGFSGGGSGGGFGGGGGGSW